MPEAVFCSRSKTAHALDRGHGFAATAACRSDMLFTKVQQKDGSTSPQQHPIWQLPGTTLKEKENEVDYQRTPH
jgi:hypothetical protein